VNRALVALVVNNALKLSIIQFLLRLPVASFSRWMCISRFLLFFPTLLQ